MMLLLMMLLLVVMMMMMLLLMMMLMHTNYLTKLVHKSKTHIIKKQRQVECQDSKLRTRFMTSQLRVVFFFAEGLENEIPTYPIPFMYGIFTYIWLISMEHVGKYTIYGYTSTWIHMDPMGMVIEMPKPNPWRRG